MAANLREVGIEAVRLATTVIGRYRVGAVLLDKKGKVCSTGINSFQKTHPTQKRYAVKVGMPHKEFLHAEIAALVKCRQKPTILVLARVDSKGTIMPVSPCPICKLALKEAGVFDIVTLK